MFEYRQSRMVNFGLILSGKASEMSTVDDIVKVLKEFDWHNYGLDLVEDAESDEWAHELAAAIMVAGRPSCGHQKYGRTDNCSEMSCPNYVHKAGEWRPAEQEWVTGEEPFEVQDRLRTEGSVDRMTSGEPDCGG